MRLGVYKHSIKLQTIRSKLDRAAAPFCFTCHYMWVSPCFKNIFRKCLNLAKWNVLFITTVFYGYENYGVGESLGGVQHKKTNAPPRFEICVRFSPFFSFFNNYKSSLKRGPCIFITYLSLPPYIVANTSKLVRVRDMGHEEHCNKVTNDMGHPVPESCLPGGPW